MRKKRHGKSGERGETLVEVLFALLIAVPALIMVAGAIETSARINSKLEKNGKQRFIFDEASASVAATGASVSVGGSESVTVYTDGTYYYFK